MQNIEIQKNIQIGLEDLVDGISKMETSALEKFLKTLNHILDNKKSVGDKNLENELVERIENVVPTFIRQRYELLSDKLQQESLSESDHNELQQIADFIEKQTVERIYLMAELAALRQTSLEETRKYFRFKRYDYAS